MFKFAAWLLNLGTILRILISSVKPCQNSAFNTVAISRLKQPDFWLMFREEQASFLAQKFDVDKLFS
jgi:hypothetical protein